MSTDPRTETITTMRYGVHVNVIDSPAACTVDVWVGFGLLVHSLRYVLEPKYPAAPDRWAEVYLRVSARVRREPEGDMMWPEVRPKLIEVVGNLPYHGFESRDFWQRLSAIDNAVTRELGRA